VDFVRSLAVDFGATTEGATTDQMRKAIAAWYLNIERSETVRTVSLEDASGKVTLRVGDTQQPTNSFPAKRISMCDCFTASQPQGTLVDEPMDSSMEEAWPSTVTNLKSSDAVKKRLKHVAFVSLLACLLLPYVILVIMASEKVMMKKRSGNCERDLKAALAGWVATEMLLWPFAAFCACVEHAEKIKRCSGSVIGLAKFLIMVMGVFTATHADRKNCDADLYDISMFLFVYLPLFIITILVCAPLVGSCCVLFCCTPPSLQQHTARQFDLCPAK